jgi:hypothetical protein
VIYSYTASELKPDRKQGTQKVLFSRTGDHGREIGDGSICMPLTTVSHSIPDLVEQGKLPHAQKTTCLDVRVSFSIMTHDWVLGASCDFYMK